MLSCPCNGHIKRVGFSLLVKRFKPLCNPHPDMPRATSPGDPIHKHEERTTRVVVAYDSGRPSDGGRNP